MRKSLYDYCLEQDRQELLSQWHPTLNGGLTPHQVSYGSKTKVWWRCDKGHEWEAIVYTRSTQGSNCPYCVNHKIIPGENDLLSQNPELAASWNFEKNKNVGPDQVSVGSTKSVWWKCSQGHEWRAAVTTRSRGSGCPVCTNRQIVVGENDLATTHPDLARQWHPTKNGNTTPKNVVYGTLRKVWWLCERGHEWKASVFSRASQQANCPVCAGKVVDVGENDLGSLNPAIAVEWHPTKNEPLTPQQVTPLSNKKAWWVCPLGHEYFSVIASRVERGNGCPYCAGRKVLKGFNDLETLEPEVASQWHPELNGALTPDQVTTGCHKKVWWQCPNEHVWKAVIYSRTKFGKSGCPVCAGKVKESRQQRYADILENSK